MKIRQKRIVAITLFTLSVGCSWAQTVLTGAGPWKLQGTTVSGQWVKYAVDVKATDGLVKCDLSQPYGEVDLYVREGSVPTLTQYDFRPYLTGQTETVSVTNETSPTLQTGRIYISVYSRAKSRYDLTITCQPIASAKSGIGATRFSNGTTFRVWAPNATSVGVAGTFNSWSSAPLVSEGNGNWSLDYRGVADGAQYKYVVGSGTNVLWKNDPRARQMTNSSGNSVVFGSDFNWTSNAYSTTTWDITVVYEMHVGAFASPSGGGVGTFDTAVSKLDYLKDLGVTTILLMPVGEFPGDYSWGYNPSYPFAVESAYGGPAKLKNFIDQAHNRGIGVMVDVVYNHFGPSDLDMWQFDGWSQNGYGGIYFYNDGRATTPWGDTRPDFGRGEVRQYVRDNAAQWLQEFRADGLRFDSTVNIRTSNWGDNGDGWSLMQWINNDKNSAQPWKLMVAEDMQNNEWLTKTTGSGGAGFDSQWAADFVHPIRSALTASSDVSRSMWSIRDAIVSQSNGGGQRRMIYTDNHDEDANGSQRLPSVIDSSNPGSYWAKRRSTLGAVVEFTSPGIPMLFMGQEFLESGYFQDSVPLDFSKATTYSGIKQLYKDLIGLRKNISGFSAGLTGDNVNVFHVNDSAKVIAYHRWKNGGSGDDVVVLANFSNTYFSSYTVGLPRGGKWNVVFSSDWQGYSSDFWNTYNPDFYASNSGYDGLGYSSSFVLAPYSSLILVQKP